MEFGASKSLGRTSHTCGEDCPGMAGGPELMVMPVAVMWVVFNKHPEVVTKCVYQCSTVRLSTFVVIVLALRKI
jgi:hypothetical protein